ncbi:MAG TPA: DNA polymerase I [Planctomycetes bacterium]|nr:DNA polymerase I [Planctomycetota bacterium]
MGKSLYIIDGHAHIYAAFYAPMRPLTSPAGEPTKATYIFTNALLGLIERAKPDMLVVAFDSKTPSFRAEIYPEYKAHRPPMPDDMPPQIDRIEEILAAMNIPALRLDRFEADDIIGTLARKASAAGIDVYICSKDKDMLQLLDKHIFTYDIKTGRQTSRDSMLAEMKLSPEQFLDVLALQGDTADNVPGVPDVGPKTALEWIQQYGSLENLYAHADQIKGKRGQSLRNSKDKALLSKELVTIDCAAPIEIDYEAFKLTEPNAQKLAEIFGELDFGRLLSKLGLKRAESLETKPEAKKPKSPLEQLQFSGDESIDTIKTLPKDYHLIDTKASFEKFCTELKKQTIFAVDTETTSADAVRADLVGVSFSWQRHQGYYIPVRAPLGQKHLDMDMVRQKFAPILADEKVKKIGQNIKYDIIVLAGAGMPLAGVYFDTMVASYCLAADRRSHSMDSMAKDFLNYQPITLSSLIGKGRNQLTFDMVDTALAAQYSAEDADVTFLLHEHLSKKLKNEPGIERLFYELEMPLVPVLAQMESAGVSLNVRFLKDMSVNITEELEELTERIHDLAGIVFNIDSPKQLAEVLFDRMGLTSLRSGKTLRSTDADVLEQLKAEHEIVELILEYRQLVKLKNTYVDKLSQLINPRTDRVHASFNQTITATGRLSSSNPNLQNIPIRTELGRKIRSAFVPAKKTDCILSADYSQIELRLLAHFSKDKALKDAFDADEDIHRFVASQIYGVEPADVTSQMRSNCKAVNFGIIYGQGPFGLSRTIGISQAQAKKFIADYFARYSSVQEFKNQTIKQAKSAGYAETILGRRRKITGLSSRNFNKRTQAERLAINTVIQGSAADLIKVAMINIQEKINTEKLPIKMILQIHDELVFELPKKDAKKHAGWISGEMTGAIQLDVPLKVYVSIGPTWLTEK